MNGWGKIKKIAAYAGVSDRTVEDWLKQGLQYIQMPSGLRLIKYQWVDEFLENFGNPQHKVDQIVNEVIFKI